MSLPAHTEKEDYERAGMRLYESLPDAQRQQLKEILEQQIVGNATWGSHVEEAVHKIIDKRLAENKANALDAAEIIDEVLPVAHAVLPMETRQLLFKKIKEASS